MLDHDDLDEDLPRWRHTFTPSPRDPLLIAIIAGPLRFGDTCAAAFAAKERALMVLLTQFSLAEARALHARLTNPHRDDPVAQAFARWIIERRLRCLAFLAAAPRRAALAAHRRAA